MNTKDYLDDVIPKLEAARPATPPDCWIVYATVRPNVPQGEPLAIYKHKQSLYTHFERLARETPPHLGTTIGAWWFDDDILTNHSVAVLGRCVLAPGGRPMIVIDDGSLELAQSIMWKDVVVTVIPERPSNV